MLKNLTQFYRPKSIKEACTILESLEKNVVLAGGTHLAVLDDKTIEGLVDLKELPLSYIRRTPSGFAIGATTPIQDIFKSSVLIGPSGSLLKKSAGSIGSTLLRNSITIGGNIIGAFPWSDLPPALLALEATVTLVNGKHERTVPIVKLFEKTPREFLAKNEILTEVQVPQYGADTGVAFKKFAKTRNDFSLITVAVRISKNGNSVKEAKIALNAISRKPQLCPEAENELKEGILAKDKLEKASKLVLKGLSITQDFRASREYRMEVLPVLVRRCLEESIAGLE